LNSRSAGEARTGDRALLLESTGRNPRTVQEMVGLLEVVFVARGWTVEPVALRPALGPDTTSRPRNLEVRSALVREIAGVELAANEVEARLSRCRLSAAAHGTGWRVGAPPWRPDLQTDTDVVEEIILAVPLRAEDGVVPPSRTLGRWRPEIRFRRKVARDLLGLGLVAPYTPLLVSARSVEQLGDARPLRVVNPVSSEFEYLRDRLLLSHLLVLGHNTRHGYPQRFGEVGPVVVRDPAAEGGGASRYHASLVVASESAGFADAAALVDYLLRRWDVASVREPVDIAGLIPGRAARVRIAGEPVAELGELHPRVLSDLGVPVPVAWAEIDLSAMWPFVSPPS
jgi:phenylalanyl-tRNA synthetase beta chain